MTIVTAAHFVLIALCVSSTAVSRDR